MSGTNWSNPVVTDTIVNYTAGFAARDVSAMTQMRSSLTADTNIPTSAIRWNDTNFNWESWSGSAWTALATTYGISISGNAATASAVAWSGISSKPTTISGYGITDINSTYAPTLTGTGATGTWGISITGNAATATTAGALTTGNNYQVNSLGIGTAASGTTGEIRATGNVVAYYSDMRLKTYIGPITDAVAKVKKLSGFYYEANIRAQRKGYTVKREVGVSAQQVKSVLPEIIMPAPVDPQYMTLDYAKLVPLLIEAIKELSAEVELLKAR